MFKLYRYMVLLMALQYRKMIPTLRDCTCSREEGYELYDYLREELSLLTEAEARVLKPAGNRHRDTVISWITREVQTNAPGQRNLLQSEDVVVNIMEKLT